VQCERRLSRSDLSVFSCCPVLAVACGPLCGCAAVLTSSALLGLAASSGFLSIFCFRLSLLAGRAAALSSASLEADRPAAGVVPRAVRELAAMVDEGCCELEAACAEFMEDDEFLGRAVAGGVERLGLSMVRAASYSSRWLPRECSHGCRLRGRNSCRWQSRCM
jgi:hypothetical protein